MNLGLGIELHPKLLERIEAEKKEKQQEEQDE